MTGASVAGPSWVAVARTHGPALHRTALMLTGRPADAESLVAEVLREAGDSRSPTTEDLRRRLAQAHLRRVRGRERVRVADPSPDVGDLLHDLPARERTAVVLHLGEGWPLERAARAARVRAGRVRRLAGSVPELREALTAVADLHARPDDEVVQALLKELPTHGPAGPDGPAAPDGVAPVGRTGATAYRSGGRRTRTRLAAATVVALVGAGTAVALTSGAEDAEVPPAQTSSPAFPPGTGPVPAELVLDPDGEPPRTVPGLRLNDTVTIDYRRAGEPLDLGGSGGTPGYARWAVLWCDLPAVDDAHLRVPELTLDLPTQPVVLPCAGRTGTPAVPRMTAVPVGVARHVGASWTGDLPGRGTATLAVYGETDPWAVSRQQGTQPVPPVAEGSVAVTPADVVMQGWDGPLHTRLVEVGHDSTVEVWAGSRTSVALLVDDVRLTDDGDLAARYGGSLDDLWPTQDPTLREGRWAVSSPDRQRTFPLPDHLRPDPGERRTVAVTVALQPPDPTARWQVQVRDATAVDAVDAEVPIVPGRPADLSPSQAPELVGGSRLVGSWSVPRDGLRHTLQPPEGDLGQLVVAAPYDVMGRGTDELAMGSVEHDGRSLILWPGAGVADVLSWGWQDWQESVDQGEGSRDTVSIRLPPVPGHGPLGVVGYLPVPYEEFDMTGAPVPPSSWRVGDPSPYGDPGQGGPRLLGPVEAGPDGRYVVELQGSAEGAMLHVTTQGRGRLRVLADGEPLTHLAPSHDGWWSSWTEEHVVSVLDLWSAPPDAELVVEVEGWEEGFEIELLRW